MAAEADVLASTAVITRGGLQVRFVASGTVVTHGLNVELLRIRGAETGRSATFGRTVAG